MIPLSHLIDHYQKDLESIHGHEMLPSHHQALRAMRRCRREGSDHMVLECQPCATTIRIPHSCVIGVALTANIMTANNGFSGKPPNCCRSPIS